MKFSWSWKFSFSKNLLYFILLQEVSAEDQKILEQFLPPEAQKRRTLQDVIMEKIKERRTEVLSGIIFLWGVVPQCSISMQQES